VGDREYYDDGFGGWDDDMLDMGRGLHDATGGNLGRSGRRGTTGSRIGVVLRVYIFF